MASGRSSFKIIDVNGDILGTSANPFYTNNVAAGGSASLVTPASGSKAANADWFASDIVIATTGILKILFALEAAAVVEITLDSTNYRKARDGNTIPANTWQYMEIPVIAGDTFNIRQTTGTITLTTCRVQQ